MITMQNVANKQYNMKTERPNVFLFSGVLSFTAVMFFIFASGMKLSFKYQLLPYSVSFAFFYVMAWFSCVYAMRAGSMALTTLANSFSLVIPTAYGIIFLKDEIRPTGVAGIVLLLLSIFLINTKGGNIKITPKWILFMTLSFIGNGMCSTVQKLQQLSFGGGCKYEFMIIALLIPSLVFLIPVLISGVRVKDLKACVGYGVTAGLSNGVLNLLVMTLTGMLPSAILYPSLSAVGITFSFIISVLVYKERLRKKQAVGYAVGIMSVILLNL